jgi:signal transduction histidine kinase
MRSSILGALGAGFAGVFSLWLLSGYQLVLSLQQMEQNLSSVHDSYVRGDETLSTVRTNVLLVSIFLRDAIIDSPARQREYYRDELARLRGEVERALRAYVPEVTSPAEREHWTRLQTELHEYFSAREVAFGDDVSTLAEAAALLRRNVVPRRQSILEIVDQLATLQRVSNQQHQAEADQLYQQAIQRLIFIGLITLVLALAVAVLASRHVNRLQREVERRRSAEQRNREDLERLSARLVGAQEEERRNLARELHDEVGQALTALKMDIGIALRGDIDPRGKDALNEARDIAETTLRGVRDLSQILHPSTLDDFGLPATLTAYLRSFSQRTGIRAQLAESIEDRLAPVVEVCVYRIVQEALSNVAKHSGATACTVSLTAGPTTLQLVIEDNGQGLPKDAQTRSVQRGLGLIGMRERAQSLGGTFLIANGVGGGTRVTVTLPSQERLEIVLPETERRVG